MKKCCKWIKIWKHVTDIKTCNELVKHIFPGGKYDKSKSSFYKDIYNGLIKKENIYYYHEYNPVVTNDDK